MEVATNNTLIKTTFDDIAGINEKEVFEEQYLFFPDADYILTEILSTHTDKPEHNLLRELLNFSIREALEIRRVHWLGGKSSQANRPPEEMPDPEGAFKWIFGPSVYSESSFTFEEVCEELKLSPIFIRQLVQGYIGTTNIRRAA